MPETDTIYMPCCYKRLAGEIPTKDSQMRQAFRNTIIDTMNNFRNHQTKVCALCSLAEADAFYEASHVCRLEKIISDLQKQGHDMTVVYDSDSKSFNIVDQSTIIAWKEFHAAHKEVKLQLLCFRCHDVKAKRELM